MFLCKLLFIFLTGFSYAQVSPSTPETKSRFARGRWELGLSYVHWNEDMQLYQGPNSASGYANYVGWGLSLEYNWTRFRWQWGAALNIEAGEAGATGFQDVTFEDGVGRTWYGGGFQGFMHYRINRVFMIGPGVQYRIRKIDWEPGDQSVLVEVANDQFISPELNMRFQVTPKFSFVQSWTALDFDRSSFWRWSLHYTF